MLKSEEVKQKRIINSRLADISMNCSRRTKLSNPLNKFGAFWLPKKVYSKEVIMLVPTESTRSTRLLKAVFPQEERILPPLAYFLDTHAVVFCFIKLLLLSILRASVSLPLQADTKQENLSPVRGE